MNPYGSQPQSQSAINPALLGQYQPKYNNAAGINPSQLMNGMMPQNTPPSMPGLSPTQLLHQQQQQQQLNRGLINGGAMNMMPNMNMMSAGINPASISSPNSPSNSMINNNSPLTATSLIAMGHHPNNQNPMIPPSMAMSSSQQMMPYGRDHQMNPNQKLMMAPQQMHIQQMPQQQQYDRPSSSASNQQQQMMPPPRPPTAQSSRPGTAMDMRTRVPMPGDGNRPPSRSGENGIMSGGPGTPMYSSPTPGASMSPPPQPGSPSLYRAGMPGMTPMKRKMPDQPPMGINMGGGPMGSNMGGGPMGPMVPPGMPQQQSLNGFSPAQIQAQTQQQRGSPAPMNLGMGMNGMANVNMGMPQQQSAVGGGIGGIAGMGNLNMGMGMGMPQQETYPMGHQVLQPPTPSQAMQPQQPMMMPQTNLQEPMRQGSLPPTGSTAQMGPVVKPPVTPARLPSVAPPSIIPGTASSIAATGDTSALSATASTSSTSQSLGPLPNLNASTTKATVVPLLGSEKTIPPLDQDEIGQMQEWMKIDKDYDNRYRKMKERMTEELRADVLGPLTVRWWEKGAISVNPGLSGGWRARGREQFDVRYPRRRDRDAGRSRKPGKREGLKLPRTINPEDANCPEQLVPIRLEFDVEHHKMRDTFVWNLNDPVVTPEHFAQTVVEDYNLPSHYLGVIAKSIHDQLNDFKAHSNNYDGEGGEFFSTENTLQAGTLDGERDEWWEAWRKRLRTDYPGKRSLKGQSRKRRKSIKMEDNTPQDEKAMGVEEFSLKEETMTEDMRILIKLDIIVGSVKLDDQFEWDLDNTSASPEHFADVYTQELGLGGEFRTAIAHSIREQVQTYQKSLFLVGHSADGSPIQDEDLKLSFLPTLLSGARPLDQVPSFTPMLNYLSDGEVERNEKERDKEMNRRKKRNTRGRRGVALPDREPIRTYRTPAIGFPELDPATQALAATAAAPARRAAAAAASVTIANMVASENGTPPFAPQPLPSVAPQPVAPPVVPKKKPKGLYKAPPVPPEVLRPRAHVTAPTPSTAADVSTLPAPLENDPPPSTSAPPDNRIPRILTAKRAKEMEREAKEKEFADGQHANYIDGVWHCSNCGCPESIAIGRRKGPLGEKSQCGTCGKFWHRHRRPRPVEYNTDPEFHSTLKRESEFAKTIAKKKGGAAALRAQSSTVPTPLEVQSEPHTPTRVKGPEDTPLKQSTPRTVDEDRAVSPVSTVSSGSESPLAQRVRLNGNATQSTSPEHPAAASQPPSDPPPATTSSDIPASPTRSWPPQWLASAMQATHLKYPNDRFDVALRRVNAASPPEWRIKCLDCPGKLYKPGPGETLSNFEVHLKNRQHRQRVDDRVNGGDP